MIVTLGMEEWTKDEVTIDYDDGFLLESGDVICDLFMLKK